MIPLPPLCILHTLSCLIQCLHSLLLFVSWPDLRKNTSLSSSTNMLCSPLPRTPMCFSIRLKSLGQFWSPSGTQNSTNWAVSVPPFLESHVHNGISAAKEFDVIGVAPSSWRCNDASPEIKCQKRVPENQLVVAGKHHKGSEATPSRLCVT